MESGDYSAAFSGFKTKRLEGEEGTMGELVAGKKAILIVNVASEWGVTKRDYEQLVQLYTDLAERGLEILAYPCNQFGD